MILLYIILDMLSDYNIEEVYGYEALERDMIIYY